MSTSTKHAPATLLPWHHGIKQAKQIVYDASGWAVANATVYHGHAERDETKANAAYIAHACNAYPQLVERAQLLCEFVDAVKDCIPDWRERMKISEEGYTPNMRALLRALGEEEPA